MSSPDPGSRQPEVSVEDVEAVLLHEADHAGVAGRIQQECGEGLGAGDQGGLDGGEEVWEGGENLPPVKQGAGQGVGKRGQARHLRAGGAGLP